jgi:hypothetical protein
MTQQFREFTATELARALSDTADDDLDVVVFELQAADGTVIACDVSQLQVSVGQDFDRIGAYRWVKITGRVDSR